MAVRPHCFGSRAHAVRPSTSQSQNSWGLSQANSTRKCHSAEFNRYYWLCCHCGMLPLRCAVPFFINWHEGLNLGCYLTCHFLSNLIILIWNESTHQNDSNASSFSWFCWDWWCNVVRVSLYKLVLWFGLIGSPADPQQRRHMFEPL